MTRQVAIPALLCILGLAAGYYLRPGVTDQPVEAPVPAPVPAPARSVVEAAPDAAPKSPDPKSAIQPSTSLPSPGPNKCPECKPCEQCKPAPVCPASPSVEAACAPQIRKARQLEQQLAKATGELRELEEKAMSQRRYDGTTAQARRVEAANDNNLLLEVPAWGEEFYLPEHVVAETGLRPKERERLEEMYGQFRKSTFAELQKLYGELMGDPNAGVDSTLNALVHNIMELSPKDMCRERTLAVVAALATGAPLAPPGPDAPACEQAMYLMFVAVDHLEQEVAGSLGEQGSKALWSGSSTFSFSVSAGGPGPQGE